MARGRGRVGAKSAKRRQEGGALALGRASTTLSGYQYLRARLIARSGGYDEIVGRPTFGTDVAHVVARSAGGPDDVWNTLWLSRPTHRLMEAPFAKGRIIAARVMVQGVKGISWVRVKAVDKFAYQRGEYVELASGFVTA